MEEIIVIDYYDGSVWIYKLPWLNMDDTAEYKEGKLVKQQFEPY